MPEPISSQPIVAAAVATWLTEQNMSLADLRSRDRTQPMVEARRRTAAYLRQHGWSLPKIGRFLERDHTTVLHYLRSSTA